MGQINKKIEKHLYLNNNKNTTNQNLWDAATAVVRGKFITLRKLKRKELNF